MKRVCTCSGRVWAWKWALWSWLLSGRGVLSTLTCLSLFSLFLTYRLSILQGDRNGERIKGYGGMGGTQGYPPPLQRDILSSSVGGDSRRGVVAPPSQISYPLLSLITKMERIYLTEATKEEPVVLVRGQKYLVVSELRTYTLALRGGREGDMEGEKERLRKKEMEERWREGDMEESRGGGEIEKLRDKEMEERLSNGEKEEERLREREEEERKKDRKKIKNIRPQPSHNPPTIRPQAQELPTTRPQTQQPPTSPGATHTTATNTGVTHTTPTNTGSSQTTPTSTRTAHTTPTSTETSHTTPLKLVDTTVRRVKMMDVGDAVYYVNEDDLLMLEGNQGSVTSVDTHGWRLMLCLTYTDGDSSVCLPKGLFTNLRPHQKVGRMPGLKSSLWKREALCDLTLRSPLVQPIHSLTPPCYAHPAHTHLLKTAAQALPDAHQWVVKPAHHTSGRVMGVDVGGVEVIDNKKLLHDLEQTRLRPGQIIQSHWGPPLQILGASVCVRVYLLLTSLQPLRAHAHTHAEVTFRTPPSKGYAKIEGRAWTWDDLVSWVRGEGGDGAVDTLVGGTEEALTTLALTADLLLPTHWKKKGRLGGTRSYRCENCFQLLGIDFVYNSTYHPTIISITGQPDLSLTPPTTPTQARGRVGVARDLLRVLVGMGRRGWAYKLTRALTQVADNIGVVGVNCLLSHDLCLTQSDLSYLMETRRENGETKKRMRENESYVRHNMVNSDKEHGFNRNKENVSSLGQTNINIEDTTEDGGKRKEDRGKKKESGGRWKEDEESENKSGFVMIYPSPVGHIYNKVINELYQSVSFNTSSALAPASYLLTESWRHLTRDLHDLLTSLEHHFRPLPPGVSPMMAGLDLRQRQQQNAQQQQQQQQPNSDSCMKDPSTAPYLKSITLDPPIPLTPSFSPLTLSYKGEVGYGVIAVRVRGSALNCQAEARLDDKSGTSMVVNHTLGLGETRITLAVVDVSHSEPHTLNLYTLSLTRRPPPAPHPPPTALHSHQVCGLRQECDLRIWTSEDCGLKRERKFHTWSHFNSHRLFLPLCERGDAEGRWVLPCASCEERASCDFALAVWQPLTCTHNTHSHLSLQRCLAGKTLVFVGDSTNRGMHYKLMELANGTLNEWKKIHDLKVTRISPTDSEGRVTFAYGYYPKFWLQKNKRTTFDYTLSQLLLRTGPLHNSTKTVIVVGGVRWVAYQHLRMLSNVLKREGLEGAKVVIKTHGAGFHVASPGVHTVSQEDHVRLLGESLELARSSRQQGYSVIDTFNMTVARFKHFLQGKCACHFHQVRPERLKDNTLRYEVQGEINNIYTNILTNEICRNER